MSNGKAATTPKKISILRCLELSCVEAAWMDSIYILSFSLLFLFCFFVFLENHHLKCVWQEMCSLGSIHLK